MTTPATLTSGQRALRTATNLLRLLAIANPATAGYVAIVTGAKELLTELFIDIRAAVEKKELTAEQEAALRTENDAFWGSIESGAAFAASHWNRGPRTNVPGD